MAVAVAAVAAVEDLAALAGVVEVEVATATVVAAVGCAGRRLSSRWLQSLLRSHSRCDRQNCFRAVKYRWKCPTQQSSKQPRQGRMRRKSLRDTRGPFRTCCRAVA